MSKYKVYATRADELAKAAFKEYTDAANKLQQAESKAKAYPQKVGAVDPEYFAKSARAAADLAEAKRDYETAKSKLSDMNKQIANIRVELQREIEKDNRADPEAVDTATMELLKSGILKTEDYIGLLDRHQNNNTMKRLIKHYAMSAADNMKDGQDRQRLKALALSADGSNSTTLNNFDVIAEVCRRTENNPRMIQSYEQLTAQVIEEM